MTLSINTNRISYVGDGIEDTFAYTWKIFDDDDLRVYVNAVLKTKTTHYTVSGVGVAGGGDVVFTAGNIPAANAEIIICRVQPTVQEADLITNGQIPAEVVEQQFDKLCMQIQDIPNRLSKVAVKLGANQTIPTSATTKITLNSKIYDALAEFDATTNYRFTASVAGGYLVIANVRVDYIANAGPQTAHIRHTWNAGALFAYIASDRSALGASEPANMSLSAIVNMAATDYLELYVENLAGGDVTVPLTVTKMEIVRVW